MKSAFAALVVLLSSLVFTQISSASSNPPGCENGRSTAQTCTATFYGQVSVPGFGSSFIPCLNGGKGENVIFTDTESTLFYYKVTAGKRNGFLMSVGGGMHGKGQTTGINYTARDSTQNSFANWIPFNPDGSANGDGEFTYTDNYYINSTYPVTNHIWHRTVRFSVTNNGVNGTQEPDQVVCR
jgi:hypothetical protein